MKQQSEDMKIPSVENYWGYLIRQMPLALVLGVMAWLLWGKVDSMEDRVTNCNNQVIEIMKAQIDASQAAMSRNSDIMKENSEAFTNFSNYLNQKTRRGAP